MSTDSHTENLADDEYLAIGRSLMDPSFKALFLHDPQSAMAMLQIVLAPDAVERVIHRLSDIQDMSGPDRGRFISRVNARERWKEM